MCTLERLPWEMWFNVFSYFELSQLCVCQLVCRAWRGRCHGHWDRFLPTKVPFALVEPHLRSMGSEAKAALCFRGQVRQNTCLPRFRSGVLSVAPPAFHVAITEQFLFAADDGQIGVAVYGMNMPDLGLCGVAPLGVLHTKTIVTCVAATDTIVACATEDGCIHSWALQDLRSVFRKRMPIPGTMYQIVFGQEGKFLVTASVQPGLGQHVAVVDGKDGATLAVVGYGDDIIKLYVPPGATPGELWVVVQLSHSLNWWRLSVADPQGDAATPAELQHGKVEFRRAGVAFLDEDRLQLPTIPLAAAGSTVEPVYAMVAPRNQILLLWWPRDGPGPPSTFVLRDVVPCSIIHKVCFSSKWGHLLGSCAQDNGKVGVFAFTSNPQDSTLASLAGLARRPASGWAKHCWLPNVKASRSPEEAVLDVTCLAADDFLARVFVLCSNMQLHILDSVTLLTLATIQCFEPGRKGPLQALVTQVQVRNNVVIVHPLPARMQESNTLVLDFQPADHMLCHGAARPDVHRRSLELLRRCWEFKYGCLQDESQEEEDEGEALLATTQELPPAVAPAFPLCQAAPGPPATPLPCPGPAAPPDDDAESTLGATPEVEGSLAASSSSSAAAAAAAAAATASGLHPGDGSDRSSSSSSSTTAEGTDLTTTAGAGAVATPPTAEPELCVAPAVPAVPAAGLGGSSAAGPLSRPGLGLTATPDRLRDLLQGLAAMERPGVVVLRSTHRQRLGHLPYALGSLVMAGVLGCSALLFDGRTLFGLPLRYRWLALPHCLAMLTHLWFAYPHLDYFFGDKTRGAELEFTTMLLTSQFFHFLTTLVSHILLPVLVLLKMDDAIGMHWAWIAACFQVRYLGRLVLYGWQWHQNRPIRQRFPGLFGGGFNSLWQVNTALFCVFSFLMAFWLEGTYPLSVTTVFTPIWVSLGLMVCLEVVLPWLRPRPPASEEPAGRGMADHVVFCVVLYVIPMVAMYLRLTHILHIPFLLVLAPHMVFLLVSFAYCLYAWHQNYVG